MLNRNIFDTKVQALKNRVLTEVAKATWEGKLFEEYLNLPLKISPSNKNTLRCCIHKDRSIALERVKIAAGGDFENENIIQVIPAACDECPMGGYEVTNSCRGCLAHRCEEACKKDAIVFDQNRTAHIDKSICINCGMCSKVCPYNAIVNRKRPCESACKVKAITLNNDDSSAKIDYSKCIECGSCVYQCPFGAINDKSYIVDVINALIKSDNNKNYKVYAIIAPAIASQFSYAKFEQVITGIKKLGFYDVYEASLSADMVTKKETEELIEKGFLTSSCCPAFVKFIENNYPELKQYISHNFSPMGEMGKYIKSLDKNSKVVFIGPCIAKKAERKKASIREYVNYVITFEELQALFDSKNIDITTLEETSLDTASPYGRIFGRSAGLAEAVTEWLKETNSSFPLQAAICSGIDECNSALFKKSKNLLKENFIEGMACIGGCINGAGNLMHAEKNRSVLDKHASIAKNKTISDSLKNVK